VGEHLLGQNGTRGGIMVRELTTGALAAMAWLVVTATLTLIAAFIASVLA